MRTAKIDLAASGDVVSAVAGKKIRVTSLHMASSATLTAKFQSGAATDLEGARTMVAGVPHTLPFAPALPGELRGYFETAAGEKLNLVLVGAGQVSGHLTYEHIS